MDAIIPTIIVMIPLFLIWMWGRYSGMKTVMNMMKKELEKEIQEMLLNQEIESNILQLRSLI